MYIHLCSKIFIPLGTWAVKLLIMGYEFFRGQMYLRPEEEKARQPSLSLPEPRESQCCLRTFFCCRCCPKSGINHQQTHPYSDTKLKSPLLWFFQKSKFHVGWVQKSDLPKCQNSMLEIGSLFTFRSLYVHIMLRSKVIGMGHARSPNQRDTFLEPALCTTWEMKRRGV